MNFKWNDFNCTASTAVYTNGRVALFLDDTNTGEAIAVASINIPEAIIPKGYAAIKNYGENEGVLEALIENKIIGKEPFCMLRSGHISDIPVHEILI